MEFVTLCAAYHSFTIVALCAAKATAPERSLREQSCHEASRPFLGAQKVISSAITLGYSLPALATVSADENPGFNSVESTAAFIKKHCATMLDASRESGVCLYRGESVVKSRPILLQSFSDLQDPKTYNSFAAADFFQSYDNFTLGLFNAGHIGTPSLMEASAWGGVVSVWPLDDPVKGTFDFCWLRRRKWFWDDAWGLPQSQELSKLGGPFWWRDPKNLNNFLSEKENLALDVGLATALSAGHEVMFSNNGKDIAKSFEVGVGNSGRSSSRYGEKASQEGKASSIYVAVPLLYEARLLAALDVQPYSSSISATKVKPVPDSDTDRNFFNANSRQTSEEQNSGIRTGMGRSATEA